MSDIFYCDFSFERRNRAGEIAGAGFDGTLDKIIKDGDSITVIKGRKNAQNKVVYINTREMKFTYSTSTQAQDFGSRLDVDGDKKVDYGFFGLEPLFRLDPFLSFEMKPGMADLLKKRANANKRKFGIQNDFTGDGVNDIIAMIGEAGKSGTKDYAVILPKNK